MTIHESLKRIYDDLNHVLSKIEGLDKTIFDKSIEIPLWQKTGKSYTKEFRGNLAKFYVHGEMLTHPQALIQNDPYNRKTIKKISTDLKKLVESYAALPNIKPDDKFRAMQLAEQLGGIESTLSKISRHIPPTPR